MIATALSDAELLAQARQGDEAAFTELYVRHESAARRLASSYRRAGDPDDLVNEAFERVLNAIKKGAGPDEAFRAYLFVTLRRLAVDRIARAHDEPVDEVPEPVRAEEQSERLDPGERQIVLAAYESLPERWQAVLWQTAVEGRQPRELAPAFGMSANAAAALAYRAREKLRQAYLQAHLQVAPHPECEPYRSRLGAYVRDGLGRRDRNATEAHLEDCAACSALLLELRDIDRMLVRAIQPLFLATAAQVGTAVVGGALLAGGAARVWTKARSNPGVVGGIAAVAAAALALALVVARGGQNPQLPGVSPSEEEEAAVPPPGPSAAAPAPGQPSADAPTTRASARTPTSRRATPSQSPTTAAAAAPTFTRPPAQPAPSSPSTAPATSSPRPPSSTVAPPTSTTAPRPSSPPPTSGPLLLDAEIDIELLGLDLELDLEL